MRGTKQHVKLEIDMPPFTTLGDLTSVKGALFEASTTYVDWEALYHGEERAVSAPGTILLALAKALDDGEPTKGTNRATGPAFDREVASKARELAVEQRVEAERSIIEAAKALRDKFDASVSFGDELRRLVHAVNKAGL